MHLPRNVRQVNAVHSYHGWTLKNDESYFFLNKVCEQKTYEAKVLSSSVSIISSQTPLIPQLLCFHTWA